MPETYRLDRAAALVVCLVLAVSVLYPENFITGVSFFGSASINPVTLTLPVIALASIIYIYKRQRELRPGWADASFICYTLYVLVRNITSGDAINVAGYVILGLAVFYMTALVAKRGEACLMYFLYTLVGLTLATAFYGLVEYAVQENIIYGSYVEAIVAEPASGVHRIGSTLGHPVPYGAFLVQALPFAVLLWFVSRARWQRVLALATLFGGALALFLTYSKGTWIVALILAVGAIAFGRGAISRKFVRPAILMAVMIAVATGFFWSEIRDEIEGRSFDSVEVRLKAWEAAIDATGANPVFGVGLRQGSREIVDYIDPEWFAGGGRPLAVDNYYLNLLLEGGIIGASLWLVTMALILREGLILVWRKKHAEPWALAALVSLIGLLLNAVTFEALHIWPNFILFWLAAGMIHGLFWRSADASGAAGTAL